MDKEKEYTDIYHGFVKRQEKKKDKPLNIKTSKNTTSSIKCQKSKNQDKEIYTDIYHGFVDYEVENN